MSLPTAVFLDTNVLERQHYNFSALVLSSFVPACQKRKLKLLLPEPTEREIRRHIDERCKEAVAAFEKGRRAAPFLDKWKGFPQRETGKFEVSNHAHAAWSAFLKQFDVVRLGYGDIRLKTVMDWYEASEPPFGIGKKRKEFPDAFAIASLAAYAQKHESFIAVVSEDNDLKASCDRYASLMHFRSLPVLTELLLSEDDGRVVTVRAALDAATDKLTTAAYDIAASDVSFYQTNDYLNIEQSEVSDLDITDVRIVGLGEHECTITFDVVLQARHYFEWHEPDSDGQTHTVRETVSDHYYTSGTAKITLDDTTGAFAAIPYLQLDDELEVEKTPETWWGHGTWR